MIKWNSEEHPRWPAGSDDSQGGRFAPKDEDGEPATFSSQSDIPDRTILYNSGPDTAGRDPRVQLADVSVGDASDDPVAEAARRAAHAVRRDKTHRSAAGATAADMASFGPLRPGLAVCRATRCPNDCLPIYRPTQFRTSPRFRRKRAVWTRAMSWSQHS
jgi:hypothetical protein